MAAKLLNAEQLTHIYLPAPLEYALVEHDDIPFLH